MNFSLGVIVLNWNRASLLRRCLDSLMDCGLEASEQIHVIDNASTDGSAELLAEYGDGLTAHLMPENRGAEWINDLFGIMETDLVFILANDKVLLPGWREYTDRAFAAFDDLAQLALHAPAPLDNEVWVVKPADFLYKDGVGIYRAVGNTGLSSVIRRSAVLEVGARFHNIPSDGPYKLPNDGRFSAELQAGGYMSAWSDRYYCLNVGHEYAEMKAEWAYYEENYNSKKWLKIEGLKKRIEEFEKAPKPRRESRILSLPAIPECRPFKGDAPERAWSIYGGGCSGIETVDFFYALIRLIKPRSVFVCRSWTGEALLAATVAIQDNGFGELNYYEPDLTMAAASASLLCEHGQAIPAAAAIARLCEGTELLILSGHAGDLTHDSMASLLSELPASLKYMAISNDFSRLIAQLFPDPEKSPLAGFSGLTLAAPCELTILSRSHAGL